MDKSSPSVPQPSNSKERSTEYVHTPFGVRKKSFRIKPKAQDERNPTSGNVVDSELKNLLAKRHEKIANPNSLQEFEEAVRMANTRTGTKPNEDRKDSELSRKLQERKKKIT